MGIADRLGDAVASNFVFLIVLIVVLIIIIVIARTVTKVKASKTAAKMAEIGIDSKKLEILSKRAYLDELKNASVVLTDDERRRIDSIKTDNAVLSRKTIVAMNEVEERTNRLERGSDLGRLSRTLDKIKRYEKNMFKNIGG